MVLLDDVTHHENDDDTRIKAILVSGRNSSGMASELGSMKVTEQIDAMRAMGVDMPAWGAKSNSTSKEIGEILA